MVISGTWSERPVTFSIKSNCLTISVDDPREATVFSYDYEGRLWTAFFDRVSYRRGLDGRILAKWRVPGRERERCWLPVSEALKVEEYARRTVIEIYNAVQSGSIALDIPLTPQGHLVLERIALFDPVRSRADAVRFDEIYKPVGILPPDQYMAIVLQVTEGCSFNTCTFCSFYKDRQFRIKDPKEFRAHAEAVRDFLGAGLSLRRMIFLGDANALVIPMSKLVTIFDIVNEIYDARKRGGIYAFLDGFSGEKKSLQDYAALAERGLVRVYIGLESGNGELLEFLKKPGSPEDAVGAVRAMKTGGVSVGVIVLLGAGGCQYAREHIEDTTRVLNSMELDNNDIIYFSELITSVGMPYAKDANRAGLIPLTHAEQLDQREAIKYGLEFVNPDRAPRVSRYDIREFVY